jgi:hypothetical protein
MTFWIREFVNRKTDEHVRVYSDALDLPSMRKLVAAHRHDDDWLDADIWVHQARLDMQRDGTCQLGVEPVDD